MKPLHTARHAAEAHLIRGYLEANGVQAIVRGQFLAGGIGELPADLCKVWVIDDASFARADALVRPFLQGDAACTQCHEPLEGQFTECWNCGAARPVPAETPRC